MPVYTFLDLVAIPLILIHFGIPIGYYWYAKNKWLPKPWNIKRDPKYRPKITIIVPTYNEEKLIQKKLENIYEQEYPREKLEIIIIDSASKDKTVPIIRKWIKTHPEINIKLIEEPVRKGKAIALNNALKHANGDIIIITDVDSYWKTKNTLNKTVEWFNDPIIGAVSCLKTPLKNGVEKEYRQYYNILRLAESKAWSTPIFHGELAAYRKTLLEEIGGFPTNIGADDSHTATKIALKGYRTIIPENLISQEIIPKNYSTWRIRRAQHLIQHFTKTIKSNKNKINKEYRKILIIESFLHILNPWILLTSTLLLILSSIVFNSFTAIIIIILGIILLTIKSHKTWITQQLYLLTATIKNLQNKQIVWKKQIK